MSDDDLDEDLDKEEEYYDESDFDPALNVLPEEVERILRDAPAIELISLSPSASFGEWNSFEKFVDEAEASGSGTFDEVVADDSLFSDRPRTNGSTPLRFHSETVLGSVRLDDPSVRDEVLGAVRRGIAESSGDDVLCWEPRHGLRAILDGITADLVICYECDQIEVYCSGRRVSNLYTSGKPSLILNRILKEAGVPIAD